MPRRPSKQEVFAQNLGGTPLGVAVYHPIPLKGNSGRVGDVAFFNGDGGYEWIANAFDTDVRLFPNCS
jgi:hypothetical protein